MKIIKKIQGFFKKSVKDTEEQIIPKQESQEDYKVCSYCNEYITSKPKRAKVGARVMNFHRSCYRRGKKSALMSGKL